MATEVIKMFDGDGRRLMAIRQCASEKEAKNTNGDRVRVSLQIRKDYAQVAFRFDRETWKQFSEAIQASFDELPNTD